MMYQSKDEATADCGQVGESLQTGQVIGFRRLRRAAFHAGARGLTAVAAMVVPAPVYAQSAQGTISGTVLKEGGVPVAQCTLTITNVATGVATTAVTNAQGFYTAPNLIPGIYTVKVSAATFKTRLITGINLEVGAQLTMNMPMQAGSGTDTLDASKTRLGTGGGAGNVVGSAAVVDLPLNGRSWTDLSALQAGVSQVTTQGQTDSATDTATVANRGYGAKTSIGGARPSQNNYRLDGISINDYSNGVPANVVGQTAGVDSIKEFSVLTTNYTAAYGMTSGGVVNAITRSGSKDFHGSAYEFIRNSAVDARNYFDPPTIPAFRRNQFGGSVGGPIVKDRTFFFANYEGLRQYQSISIVDIVPSAAARTGQLCSMPVLALSTAPCTPATVTVDKAAAAYLPFFPLPNGGLAPTGHGDTGYFDLADPQIVADNFFTVHIDHRISNKDQLHGTYQFGRSPFTFPDAYDINVLGFNNDRQDLSVEESHLFNDHFVNTARGGFFRQYVTANQFLYANNPLSTSTALGSDPGFDAARLSISGLSQFGGGANGAGYFDRAVTNYEFYDDASFARGRHAIKFGLALERQQLNLQQQPLAGTWTFGSLTNFLTNKPTTYSSAAVLQASPKRGIRDLVLGGYVQDDFSWRPNVTINLGLRYEIETIPTEVNGLFAALPSLTAATLRVGTPFFQSNPTLRDVEPRVSLSWTPFHNGKTTLRGGFGMFDSMPLAYEWPRSMSSVAPYAVAETANNAAQLAGTFYNGVQPLLLPSSQTAIYLQQNPPRTYIMQRNLSVQQQIMPSMTATVTYMGSHGLHLPYIVSDANGVIPTLTSAGYLYPNPIGSGKKINANWGEIESETYASASSYNSLQATVVKRMTKGLQFQGSFTWSKSLDNSSSAVSNNDFTNSIRNPLYFANPIPRALSDFSVSRTLAVNVIWRVPDNKSLKGVKGAAVNGWQLGGILKMNDGMPFTPTFGTGGNVAGFNNTASVQNDYPDRIFTGGCGKAINPRNPQNYVNLNCFTLPVAPDMAFWNANCDHTSKVYGAGMTTAPYPVCLNLLGNASRNSIIGPGLQDFDVSLFKNDDLGKRLKMQIRWEVFNILNRANFNPPSWGSTSDLYSSAGVPSGSAGVVTSTSSSSRQMQGAVKLTF